MQNQMHAMVVLVMTLFFCVPVFGQGTATIRHFQRKAGLQNTPLIIPCDTVPFSKFYILVPKSEYDNGTLNIKKAKLPNKVKGTLKIDFAADRSVIVAYTCKKKFARTLLEQINAANMKRMDGCTWSVTKTKLGRKVEFKLVAE